MISCSDDTADSFTVSTIMYSYVKHTILKNHHDLIGSKKQKYLNKILTDVVLDNNAQQYSKWFNANTKHNIHTTVF